MATIYLRPLACCDRDFESQRGYGCLSAMSVVCCQRSLRRTDHSSRGVLPTVARRCVSSRNLVREEAIASLEAAKYKFSMGCSASRKNNTSILSDGAVICVIP